MKSRPLLLALLLAASPVGALEWHVKGPRALGMGGAGVALAQGPLASYWNPAALGRRGVNGNGVTTPLGAHFGITGSMLEGANDLKNMRDSGTATQAEINAALDKLDRGGSGLRFDADFGVHTKAGRLGIFFNASADAGAVAQVDRVNNTQADIIAGTNNSKLIVKGANIVELGAAYGRELPIASGLYLGGALKLMSAQVGYADYFVLRNNNDENNIVSKLKDGAEKSASVGVDLGALWDADRALGGVPLKPRVGLVGRNLNNPKFRQPRAATTAGVSSRFAANPQVRLGASITPLPWWNVAADIDLTRNLTPVDNLASRQFGIGTEFNVVNRPSFNLPLRVGLMRNLEDGSAGTVLTLGAGLNFMHFMLDASAAVSNRSVATQSRGKQEKMARDATIGASMSVLFGGEAEDLGPAAPAREWKSAPGDGQPAPTEMIRRESEKAHEDLKVEELKAAPKKP